MRPVLFIVCFTLGVALMIISGYLPKSASAQSPSAAGVSNHEPDMSPYSQPLIPRVARSPDEPEPQTPAVTPAANVYVAPTPGVAGPPVKHEPTPDLPDAAQEVPAPDKAAQPDESVVDKPTEEKLPPEPVADAGRPQTTWAGWNELTLSAVGSSGAGLTYAWRQTSGPVTLTIDDSTAASTTARGLPVSVSMDTDDATYEFELTVTDAHQRTATTTARFRVQTTPGIVVTPAPLQHFALRDGYILAHYESWAAANPDTASYTFVVTAASELSFSKITGGAYEIAGGKARREYVYQITVYADPGQPLSLVELLANNADKVPGVLRLGVSNDEP